jgi:hypothetical protein
MTLWLNTMACADLDLLLSGLFHVGDHFTLFRTEVVVFVTHSQLIIKPD